MSILTVNMIDYPIMDNDRLYHFCIHNPEIKIERKSTGELNIMSPTGGETGRRNSKIIRRLENYTDQTKTGISFDSSTGFILPNEAMRSPDGAWIIKGRWEKLTKEERRKFPPICPDFVIELLSESDDILNTKNKMKEWMENGCRLSWLIDPFEQKAYIFRKNRDVEIVSFQETLKGEDVLPGFELELKELILE